MGHSTWVWTFIWLLPWLLLSPSVWEWPKSEWWHLEKDTRHSYFSSGLSLNPFLFFGLQLSHDHEERLTLSIDSLRGTWQTIAQPKAKVPRLQSHLHLLCQGRLSIMAFFTPTANGGEENGKWETKVETIPWMSTDMSEAGKGTLTEYYHLTSLEKPSIFLAFPNTSW